MYLEEIPITIVKYYEFLKTASNESSLYFNYLTDQVLVLQLTDLAQLTHHQTEILKVICRQGLFIFKLKFIYMTSDFFPRHFVYLHNSLYIFLNMHSVHSYFLSCFKIWNILLYF